MFSKNFFEFFWSIDGRWRQKQRRDDDDAKKTQQMMQKRSKTVQTNKNGLKITQKRFKNGMFPDGPIASDCFEFSGLRWNLIL